MAGVDGLDRGVRTRRLELLTVGGITWSSVPISDQDGIVFQAGGPDASLAWLVKVGQSDGGNGDDEAAVGMRRRR